MAPGYTVQSFVTIPGTCRKSWRLRVTNLFVKTAHRQRQVGGRVLSHSRA
jgi:hypothetical protein